MSPLSEPTKLILARNYIGIDDPDAAAYIAAVETADGQPLETATRVAIHSFVKGCKQDGIWPAIKASCILAGARTLAGALVPLVGVAPTNNNFVSDDYNRKTGLVGNGSTKYLDSNRAANADPNQNAHISVYVSSLQSNATSGALIGSGSDSSANNESSIDSGATTNPNRYRYRFRNDQILNEPGRNQATGLVGASRSNGSNYIARSSSINDTISQAEQGSNAFSYYIFAFNRGGSKVGSTNARLAFYSIGESLDLALLDARVTTLINAIAAAIP